MSLGLTCPQRPWSSCLITTGARTSLHQRDTQLLATTSPNLRLTLPMGLTIGDEDSPCLQNSLCVMRTHPACRTHHG